VDAAAGDAHSPVVIEQLEIPKRKLSAALFECDELAQILQQW